MLTFFRIHALILVFLAIGPGAIAPAQTPLAIQTPRVAQQYLPIEWSYRSAKAYSDPFNDVNVDVIFTNEQTKEEWRVPTFWAGGNEWKVRFAPPNPGTYSYRAESTDKNNADLNGHEGTLRVEPYRGYNSLLIHGPLQVTQDRHSFRYADGTPFLWLGDTWWDGLCNRISDEGFRTLAADRHTKGFNVVQIVAGLNPDEEPFDLRGDNAGGYAWQANFARINPAYFDAADERIRTLVHAELTPAIVGSWGYFIDLAGVAKMKQHWRNLIARWGAYPVVWIVAGEVDMPYYLSEHPEEDAQFQKTHWTEIARYIRDTDPYHRLITTHPSRSARQELTDETVLDFDMLQTGHGSWGSAANSVASLSSHRSKTPPMPVLIGETVYEGHQQTNWQDSQRFSFWASMMNGAAGYTYGAGGIWEMNGTTVPHGPSPWGITYEITPWNVAMQLSGSTQVGIGRSILMQYPWQRFEPHLEWTDPHGTAFQEPHADWFDTDKRWDEEKGNYLLPYSSGIPGQIRFIYVPPRIYEPIGPLVVKLEDNITYRAAYFDPVTGHKYDLGKLINPGLHEICSDSFASTLGGQWNVAKGHAAVQDRTLMTQGQFSAVRNDVSEADVLVKVHASSNAEAGILLRVHDPDNYILAVYSPSSKGIWIHEVKNGRLGPRLGFMEVSGLGSSIELTAETHGSFASLTIVGDERSFRTSPVVVSNSRAGNVGLWSERLACEGGIAGGGCTFARGAEGEDDKQTFSDFHALAISDIPSDANPNLVVAHTWRAPNLPVSQDWVLVLERSLDVPKDRAGNL
jgi:hypothetical protein